MVNKKTIELKDLAAGENYTVQVRAVNEELGLPSNWSLALNFNTSEDTVPPAAPTGVDVVCNGAAFTVTWVAPVLDSDGGALNDLKDYKVTWKQTSNTSNQYVEYTENLNATLNFETNVAELNTAADITVEVQARDYANLLSTAGSDNVTNVKTPDSGFQTLAADNDTVDSQAISVTWDEPTGTDLVNFTDNGDDIDYYVVYRDSVSIATLSYTPGSMKHLDPDPRPGQHTYYVEAYDKFGNAATVSNSDTATPIYAVIGSDTTPPKAPTNLVLTGGVPTESRDGSEAYMDVAFTPPTQDFGSTDPYDDNEGFIVQWNVTGSPDVFERNFSDTREDAPNDSATITARINGLDTSTSYDVSVIAFDTSRNLSAAVSGTASTPADTTAPGQPSAPSASNDTQSVLVSHDLTLQAGGSLPDDTVEMKVYASTTNGFTAGAADEIGSMQVTLGVTPVQKFSLPNTEDSPGSGTEDTWYLVVKAVDASGNVSAQSPQVVATPDLIAGANILNATIDDAKINTLSATKLVAGTAIINDLTIEDTGQGTGGKITVTNSGYLQSSNWDGTAGGNNSTTGWWLGENGLVINDGTVQADSFSVIETNLLSLEASVVTNVGQWYRDNYWTTGDNATNELTTTANWYRYGYQSIQWDASANNDELYFSSGQTVYNVDVVGNSYYYLSMYVHNPGGSGVNFRPIIKDSIGTITQGSTVSIGAGSTERLSMKFQAGASVTAILVGLQNTSGGAATVYIDGAQLEQVKVDATSPGIFTWPAGSVISGNTITTGIIESSNFAAGSQGFRIDLTGTAEFGNGTFRGAITALSGSIENDFTVNGKLRVDIDGAGQYFAVGKDLSPGGFGEVLSGLTFEDGVYGDNYWYMYTSGGTGTVGNVLFRVGDANNFMAYDSNAAQLEVKGNITGGTIDIGGADVTSFHVDSGGNMWLGDAVFANAPFSVSSTGTLTADDGEFTGVIHATGGSIDGTLTVTGLLSAGDVDIGADLGGTSGRDGIYIDGAASNSFWRQGTRTYFRAGTGSGTSGDYILFDSTRSGQKVVIDGGTSGVLFAGSITSSATITGGTIQTATSGKRVRISGTSDAKIIEFLSGSTSLGYIGTIDGSASLRLWADNNYELSLTGDNDISLGYYGTWSVTHFGPTKEMLLTGTVSVAPGENNNTDSGTPGRAWRDVYSYDYPGSGSDPAAKKNIQDSDLGLEFINSMRPIKWNWKDGGTRPHYGIHMDDLTNYMQTKGIDFAGYVDPSIGNRREIVTKIKRDHTGKPVFDENGEPVRETVEETGEDSIRFLRIGEFIGPMIKAIQELTTRVEELEAQLAP